MWTFIFLGMGLLTLAVLAYLVSRFCKFALVRRLAGGRKALRILLAALITAGIAAGCWIFIDIINMAIILVHLGAIWLICDAAGHLLERRKRERGEAFAVSRENARNAARRADGGGRRRFRRTRRQS